GTPRPAGTGRGRTGVEPAGRPLVTGPGFGGREVRLALRPPQLRARRPGRRDPRRLAGPFGVLERPVQQLPRAVLAAAPPDGAQHAEVVELVDRRDAGAGQLLGADLRGFVPPPQKEQLA